MSPRPPAPGDAPAPQARDASGQNAPRPKTRRKRAAKAAAPKLPKNLALINQIVEAFQEYTEDEVEKIADAYRAHARPPKGRPRGRTCRKPPNG